MLGSRKRGGRELAWLPWRRGTTGPLLPREEVGRQSDIAMEGQLCGSTMALAVQELDRILPTTAPSRPHPQHHQSLHPSRDIPICGQTCSDTMTCVFHLLPPVLYYYHSGSTSFPPSHLPVQFVDLLLSRSLVTPCGQVQWAFLSPHLPCPLL